MGDGSETCDQTCSGTGFACNAEPMSNVDTAAKVEFIMEKVEPAFGCFSTEMALSGYSRMQVPFVENHFPFGIGGGVSPPYKCRYDGEASQSSSCDLPGSFFENRVCCCSE